MKNSTEIDPVEFAKWLRDLPEDEKHKGNLIQLKQAEEDWIELVDSFKRGICSICGKPIKTVRLSNQCVNRTFKS